MSQQTFTQQQVESVVTKLSDMGNTLQGDERKLLDLLVASATRVVTVRGVETLEDIKHNISEATMDALERFIGASSQIGPDDNIHYAWNR